MIDFIRYLLNLNLEVKYRKNICNMLIKKTKENIILSKNNNDDDNGVINE